jgi:cell division protease FtsH
MEPEELATALKRLADWAEEHAAQPEPALRRLLREHLHGDPSDMPLVSRGLAQWDRPNFQVAIDAWTDGRDVQVVGLPVMQGYRAGLAELARGSQWLGQMEPSALEHVTVPLGVHESIACVQSGFWLVRDQDGPLVAMLKSDDRGMGESLTLEVMAPERERAERVVTELWTLMAEHNVYRGRVLELRSRHFHEDEGAHSGGGCCCTVRPAPARRSPRCTSPRRCQAAPSCC